MNVLSLFSGIGGFDFGLESTGGFRTVAFCEIEPFPRAVLARHWPDVPCYSDVRELTADRLRADGVVRPDLVCGGFPCQDVSSAGRGAGLDGERSRLWFEMLRVVDEVRPSWVVSENSPSLRSRGADRVCAGLEALGYACWPIVVGAVHAGAWHRRQRVFVVAHADVVRERQPSAEWHEQQLRPADMGQPDADAGSDRGATRGDARQIRPRRADAHHDSPQLADIALARLEEQQSSASIHEVTAALGKPTRRTEPGLVRVVHGISDRLDGPAVLDAPAPLQAWPLNQEPPIPRTVGRGVPNRIDRIAGLGNAVVPEVAAMIGRAILAVEVAL